MTPFRSLTTALGMTLLAAVAHAQSDLPAGGPGGGRPAGPPPEAVQACVGKQAGDTASATGRDGRTLSGTCENQSGVLALRPTRPQGGPPPQN